MATQHRALPVHAMAGLPISVLTDSYKASHFLQYPEAQKMVAVGCTWAAGTGRGRATGA
jgi:hypothetical protein